MSKVICDVCGTSYPETSTQCPICGCVRPADSIAVSEDSQESGGYTYVKGGRFSKSNVRKRNQGNSTSVSKDNKPINKKIIGLAIVLLFLVIIVTLMFVFIFSGLSGNGGSNQVQNGNNNSKDPVITTPEEIPCTELKLSQVEFTMTQLNEVVILDAIPQPADTTDTVKFESSDPAVVTVDSLSGKVVCVGPGKAEIKVTCGDKIATCRVTCEVEPPVEDPTEITVHVELMRKKIDDANYEGKFFFLYKSGDVSAEELDWISDDQNVATVDKTGKVTAVSEGSTFIHAQYNGVTVASCEIICKFEIPDNGEDSPEGGDPGIGTAGVLVPYSHYGTALPFEEDKNAYSVTLANGEWVGLFLRDPNNPDNTVEVIWTLDTSYGGSCTIDPDGTGVTADSDEKCRIVAQHGNSYYYIIIY